ncbi:MULTISPECIES: hypothetical protein [Brevibacterium]|uniref:hypothetical protein n=1 Tax=Brevibacterium TaxID=1696 RepID=UPI001865A5CD|nr:MULTISPECIES: hypothetical protein [Brevibacterium]
MWILGIIAASLATTLLVLLIKGGMRLVLAVLGVICDALLQAVVLVFSGVMWALAGITVGVVLTVKFLYRKITTKKTDVSDDANFDWMRDAKLRDE